MTDEDLHQPNDKLLKATFSIPGNACAFFQHHLPKEIAACIVWDSLTLEPSSFVDPQFAASESDLLFHVKFEDTETLLYLLFEHQSTEDPRMALRLLAYIVRIWERFGAANPAPAKLPPVFPIVLAQGRRPWKTSSCLEDIIDLKASFSHLLRPWQPSFVYHLLELVRTPYEALGGTPEGILALRALKAEPVEELLSAPVWDTNLLGAISKAALERLMRYIFNGEVNKTAFMERITQLHAAPLQSETMTLADQFREEGKKEGLSQGLNLGREEGRLCAMRDFILRTLDLKYGAVPQGHGALPQGHGGVPQGIREALELIVDAPRLEILLENAVRSSSLEDFAQKL